MTQALTNVLLMDAVMGSLQTQRPIIAASKLAYFDKMKHEGQRSLSLFFFLMYFSIHTLLHGLFFSLTSTNDGDRKHLRDFKTQD